MSLSWPETLSVGLFPGHCWLGGRGPTSGSSLWCAPPADGAVLLNALQTMLDEHADTPRKNTRLSLMVSDSIAAVSVLAWQEALQRRAELDSYARICLEKEGFAIDDGWTLQTAFRHFRSPGIAYALPRDWLEQLVELVNSRGLQLAAVLPISAAAYCGHCPAHGNGQSLLLLREENRTSALVYAGPRLLSRDVEPVTASGQDSGVRLLRRISASLGIFDLVVDWSTETSKSPEPANFISLCLPAAKTVVMRRSVWS